MPTPTVRQIQNRSDFAEFLEWTAERVDELVIGKQQAKDAFVKHIGKLMAEAEGYQEYLQAEYRKAKKAKRILHADKPKGNDWNWYSASGSLGSNLKTYYFDNGEAYFWTQGKLKLDPLDYLGSMAYGCRGQEHSALDLIDYQFAFLGIIHDMQRIRAGQEQIYFDLLANKTLADHVCNDVYNRLVMGDNISVSTLRDVRVIIQTALENVKSCTAAEARQENSHSLIRSVVDLLLTLYEKTLKAFFDSLFGK